MPNESSQNWNGLGVAIFVAIVLPVLYVLSCGPAAWLAQQLNIEFEALEKTIYFPLLLLAIESETICELLTNYTDFWAT